MNTAAIPRAGCVAAAIALSACASTPDLSSDSGTLIGAGSGALAGAILGDGGVILPALGAVGGAVIGEEVAEGDPIFD